MRTHGVHPGMCSAAFLALAVLSARAVTACAGAPARDEARPLADAPTALAHPEPDPACRATVREALVANRLERVVVKLAREETGRVRVVELLSPDLTPAARDDLNRAYQGCIWSPVPPRVPAGEVWTALEQVTPVAPAAP